ncbi:MAG: CDP-glucose 4,6-dehydratase, partial [Lachnospiraceae bacterium]|nr:CDP-glucose 4,6-dehydratase [Lachnospiraceae bacterium]
VFEEFRPEIVFHLAAQPIVRTSYREPVRTYETNVLGTVNVLECVRLVPGVKTVVNVTTDKVYENFEVLRPYTEEDRLDGYDPYSNSKSCSELVTHSYQRSFLSSLGIAVSTARAGNVIGGGDYAPDRIVPDAVRAAKAGVPLRVRNPYSTRPYQHVFEPLGAYLMLAEETYKHPEKAGAYNIGPDPKNELQTGTMADLFQEAWGEGFVWESTFDGGPHEAGLLKLDSSKIESVFGWKPRLTAAEAVQLVVAFEKAADQKTELETQIRSYFGEE